MTYYYYKRRVYLDSACSLESKLRYACFAMIKLKLVTRLLLELFLGRFIARKNVNTLLLFENEKKSVLGARWWIIHKMNARGFWRHNARRFDWITVSAITHETTRFSTDVNKITKTWRHSPHALAYVFLTICDTDSNQNTVYILHTFVVVLADLNLRRYQNTPPFDIYPIAHTNVFVSYAKTHPLTVVEYRLHIWHVMVEKSYVT